MAAEIGDAAHLRTLRFLAWVGERRRAYADVMDAGRTSCPRMPVWENAVDEGLVRSVRGANGAMVGPTAKGRVVPGMRPAAGAA